MFTAITIAVYRIGMSYDIANCLPESSAYNLDKHFGPRSGPKIRPAWPGSKHFDILMVFLKGILQQISF